MRERAELIKEIAVYESDVSAAMNEIQKHPWDCDSDLYTLTRADVLKVFERYLGDEINADELHVWASFLECREDIGFHADAEEILDKVIFWLANPEINYTIDKGLIEKLKQSVWSNND
jgi:hypothetical protein